MKWTDFDWMFLNYQKLRVYVLVYIAGVLFAFSKCEEYCSRYVANLVNRFSRFFNLEIRVFVFSL